MSQKVLFYQEDRPKTADGLWMHKDSNGNMKLDYVGNNSVYPLGYINSEAGGSGSTSDGYKAYIMLNPSSEYQTAGPTGLTFTTAAEAAQSLGISEQDFLRFCSVQMPMAVGCGNMFLHLNVYQENYDVDNFGYIISDCEYEFSDGGNSASFYVAVFKESSDADDSTKQYNVLISQPSGPGSPGSPEIG